MLQASQITVSMRLIENGKSNEIHDGKGITQGGSKQHCLLAAGKSKKLGHIVKHE